MAKPKSGPEDTPKERRSATHVGRSPLEAGLVVAGAGDAANKPVREALRRRAREAPEVSGDAAMPEAATIAEVDEIGTGPAVERRDRGTDRSPSREQADNENRVVIVEPRARVIKASPDSRIVFPEDDKSKHLRFDRENYERLFKETCKRYLLKERQVLRNLFNNSGGRPLVGLEKDLDWAINYIDILENKSRQLYDLSQEEADFVTLHARHYQAVMRQNYLMVRSFIEKYVGDEKRVLPSIEDVDGLWLHLFEYAQSNGTDAAIAYAKTLFPQLKAAARSEIPAQLVEAEQPPDKDSSPKASQSLPQSPPLTWKAHKREGEAPPAFVKRVYGEWLGKGLTRATVRQLDPPLAQAITNWLRHHEWPADVDLPTKSQQTTRWVERVKQEGLASVVGEGSALEALRAAQRLKMAKYRRNQQQK